MKLSLDYSSAKYAITAYQNGQVTVNQETYTRNLVVSPEQLLQNWGPATQADINADHIHELIELKPEIILLGTGDTTCFPHPSLPAIAMQLGIGFEVMDTGSACRTFNVLSAEDRQVVAALILNH